jgi:glycerol kinase
MLMHTGERPVASANRLLTTVAWRIDDRTEYALEGSVFVAGAAIQWLRDGLGIINSSAAVEGLAASVPDTGGVYLVPAFAGLGAPHWDPYARGALVGITRGTRAAHIARAALESIAFQSADLLRAMEDDTGIELPELRVDGGATANNLLMQFPADLLGVALRRCRGSETTALGAAFLAGLAVGYWRDREELASRWQLERTFLPARDRQGYAARRRGWERALERAKGWEEPGMDDHDA